MRITQFVNASLVIFVAAIVTGCTDEVRVINADDIYFATESSYCTTNATFTPSYTIDGYAHYRIRPTTGTGLGAVSATNHPIRRAEIQVLNASGTIVQCSETQDDGYYSVTVPQDGGTYTVKVLSRSYNAYNKASVLDIPSTSTPYSVTRNFTASSSQTLLPLIAYADNSDLRGGAFNILDQAYEANDFLLNNATGVNQFTVDHKVTIYWKKGINPVTYYGGDGDSGVSFYVPGTDRLFILGGIDGDVTTGDTDHFDNSVIVHELGHFVEDNYAATDSPGGAHYGIFTIDPRLAWSEGFSTYFSTQVLNDPIYKDTVGIGGGFGFYYDAENDEDASGDPMDTPTAGSLGEGGYRELAVLRMLWASTDALMPFDELWDAYVGDFVDDFKFREISAFLKVQDDNAGTDISALLDDDDKEMTATRASYGIVDNAATTDDTGDPLCVWALDPVDPNAYFDGYWDTSDQFYNNHFFYIYHAGGTLQVDTTYIVGDGDLDIYIYKDGYSYGVGADIQTYSNGATATESVNTTVPAGHYMINVMVFGGSSATGGTTYNLTINGNVICR